MLGPAPCVRRIRTFLLSDEALTSELLVEALDVAGQARHLHQSDDTVGQVEARAVLRMGGGGMVGVMSTFPQRQDLQRDRQAPVDWLERPMPPRCTRRNRGRQEVVALVRGRVLLPAPDVANAVDAPRHVVHEEDSHAGTPDEAVDGGLPPGHVEEQPQSNPHGERDHQRHDGPPDECTREPHQRGIAFNVLGEMTCFLVVVDEHPGEVGMPEAAPQVALMMRAMDVVLLVAMSVVKGMIANPGKDGSFQSQGR